MDCTVLWYIIRTSEDMIRAHVAVRSSGHAKVEVCKAFLTGGRTVSVPRKIVFNAAGGDDGRGNGLGLGEVWV